MGSGGRAELDLGSGGELNLGSGSELNLGSGGRGELDLGSGAARRGAARNACPGERRGAARLTHSYIHAGNMQGTRLERPVTTMTSPLIVSRMQ